MDEIEYKLKKNNSILAAHSITKLIDIIRNKYIAQQNISTEQRIEIAELKVLREKCGDDQNIVSLTACQAMVHLVDEGFLQVAPTLSDFIAALSSTNNYTGIIQGIGSLLLHDMVRQMNDKKEYECSFSISSPQHPLITVLRQHKSTWSHVVNQIQYLFYHHDQKIVKNSFILLRPVIMYILCDPCIDVPEKCRSEVWNILIRLSSKSNVQEYILDLLPWIQSPESLLFKANLTLELIETAYIKNITPLYIGLLPYLASLTHEIIAQGEDPRPYLSTINKIISESKTTEANNYILFIFCETLVICPSMYLEHLVRMCSKIIKLGNINPIICEMVIASFLQWMIYPSIILKTSLDIAHDTIKYIHKNYKIDQKPENILKIISNKWLIASTKTDARVQRVTMLIKLCESFRVSQKLIVAWLKRILTCERIMEKILPLILGIFITDYNNSELSETILKILLIVVKFNSELGAKVLILILHKLSKEHNPKIQLLLLNSIPEMAVLKENVPLVAHTLESLENGPRDLQGMSIDLYTKLWKIEVRCYPYLQRVLLQTPKNQNLSTELDIVKATALKEICLLRPEHHGTEVVSLLSNILNRCGDNNGSLASSLALEGIAALCKTSIVDVGSTWKALSPKLSKDKRPLVISSLCKLFSEVPALRVPSHEYDILEHEVIAKLWSYVITSDDTEIIKAAFHALSAFNIQNFTLKEIPQQFSQNLKLPAQYTKTPIDAMRKPEDVLLYIPGECWIQLLQNVNEKGLDAACNYLISCVKEEISEYRSKVYSVQQGQGEPFNYNANLPAKSIVRALATYIIHKAANTIDNSKRDITTYCLRILSQDYDKPLPPLNWCFLHELFHLGIAERKLCIIITAKQSITSGTAQRFIENYVVTFQDFEQNEEEMLTLYSVLRHLAKTVQPSSLKEFLDRSFKYAFEKPQTMLIKTLFSLLKDTLLDSTIHEANRNLISQLLELYLDKIQSEDEIFENYTDCIIELSQVYIERMTSPTVWWEVNEEKLRKAILIRKKMALRTDIEKPLVWFNECIDAVMSYPSQQIFTLRQIYDVLCKNKKEATIMDWYLELMGRIQSILLDKEITQSAIEFFCDIFILVVITVAEYNCLTVSDDTIIISREIRMSLLPQATLQLLESPQWESTIEETIDFYLHMMSANIISNLYKNMFRDGLIALKYAKHFKKHSIWMRCLTKVL